MEFNHYNNVEPLDEGITSMITTIIKKVVTAPEKFKKKLKSDFKSMLKVIKDHGLEDKYVYIINKDNRLAKAKLQNYAKLLAIRESTEINEDFKNFLRFWKGETYPALSIFPTLQIWFELDKLLDGAGLSDLNIKKMFIYGTLWVIIVIGQHAILFKKWKKEHPDEYEEEGKPGIFRRGKKVKTNPDAELEKIWAEKKGGSLPKYLKRRAD